MSTLLLPTLWMLVSIAAITDVARRLIPNPLIVVGLLLGPALQLQLAGVDGLLRSLGGVAIAFVVLVGPWAMRWMGGGDVKLTMVVGAFLGWKAALIIILAAHVLHLGVALLFLALKRIWLAAGRAPPPALDHLPKAVAIAAATILTTTIFSG